MSASPASGRHGDRGGAAHAASVAVPARGRLPGVVLLGAGAGAAAALATGASWLTLALPGGLPLGNLLAALGLCSLAGASLALSRRGTALRTAAGAGLACAASWLPLSVALAGNLALDFHDGRGAAWLGFSQSVLALVLGTLAWALAAALRRRLSAGRS